MPYDVLIIAHFCGDFDGSSNNRFNYIAEMLAKQNANVELLTSDFSHNKKSKRPPVVDIYPYKVTLISEPKYKKNVSVKRFFSHFIFSKRIGKYLKKRKKPDVIYCAVPSLDVALTAGKYAKKHNIRFIVDVQDLWPEAFGMILRSSFLKNIIFYPMRKMANYIYSLADEIIAVSETYADRAMQSNRKVEKAFSIFLGTDLSFFDKEAKENLVKNKPTNEIWIGYVGTLGHSYDIKCVIDAIKILQKSNMENIRLIIIGDGPLRKKFENYAATSGIKYRFMGRIKYPQMVGMLCTCDIAVNPIVKGAAGSIINKHADYAAAGLPVVNSQECMEYRELIKEFNCGLSCQPQNPQDMAKKLKLIISNEQCRKTMGANSRILATKYFDRTITYKKISEIVLSDKKPLTLAVLVSTMNLSDGSLSKKMNITGKCLIINQSFLEETPENTDENVRVITYRETGLSNSRNRALENAECDIALLSDDDVIYNSDYEEIILEQFKINPDYDIITFQLEGIDIPFKKYPSKGRKLGFIRAMKVSSVEIAFRLKKVKNAGVKFNTLLGSGSKYQMGEESAFLYDCLRKGLKIKYVPIKIGGSVRYFL